MKKSFLFAVVLCAALITPTIAHAQVACVVDDPLACSSLGTNYYCESTSSTCAQAVGNTICEHPAITVVKSDCQALVALYQNTDGDNRINNQGRLTDIHMANRAGVRTTDQRVTQLLMTRTRGRGRGGSNGLSGTLPDELGNLTGLTKLRLHNNNLTGPLPDSLGNLTALEQLYLYNNNFSGSLPASMGNLHELQRFYIMNNQVSGELPPERGTMTQLMYLNLGNNQISGELPPERGTMTQLRYLSLENNQVAGTIPDAWQQLQQLTYLKLQRNALTRDNTHQAQLAPALQTRRMTINNADRSYQADIMSPMLSGGSTIPPILTNTFSYAFTIEEESYALDALGAGMEISFAGPGLCEQLTTTDTVVATQGEVTLQIQPQQAGAYGGCMLVVQDHGGNYGTIQLSSFDFNTAACGNGTIDVGEQCDGGAMGSCSASAQFCSADTCECIDKPTCKEPIVVDIDAGQIVCKGFYNSQFTLSVNDMTFDSIAHPWSANLQTYAFPYTFGTGSYDISCQSNNIQHGHQSDVCELVYMTCGDQVLVTTGAIALDDQDSNGIIDCLEDDASGTLTIAASVESGSTTTGDTCEGLTGDDHLGCSSIQVVGGAIMIDPICDLHFGDVIMSPQDQYHQLSYEEMNCYIAVTDMRGIDQGFYLDFSMTDMVSIDGKTIGAQNITLTSEGDIQTLMGQDNPAVTAPILQEVVMGANYTLIQKADGQNTEVGKFAVQPSFTLKIPAHQPAATYKGTLTLTLLQD